VFGVMAAIFLLVGVGLLVYCAIAANKQRRFLRRSQVVVGQVTDLRWGSAAGAKQELYPRVRFATQQGQTVEVYSAVGQNPSPYRVGMLIRIRYDLTDPNIVIPDSTWAVWLVPCVIAFMAAIALFLGLTFLSFAALLLYAPAAR
jgi:hypothetical protein